MNWVLQLIANAFKKKFSEQATQEKIKAAVEKLPFQYFLLLISMALLAVAALGKGSSMFSTGDFKDMTSLALKLRDGSEPISAYLKDRLSVETRRALTNYAAYPRTPTQLQRSLVDDFNEILGCQSIFETNRFTNITLREETMTLRLRTPKPQAEDLIRLNRLLLEDAYSQEISKNILIVSPRVRLALVPIGFLTLIGAIGLIRIQPNRKLPSQVREFLCESFTGCKRKAFKMTFRFTQDGARPFVRVRTEFSVENISGQRTVYPFELEFETTGSEYDTKGNLQITSAKSSPGGAGTDINESIQFESFGAGGRMRKYARDVSILPNETLSFDWTAEYPIKLPYSRFWAMVDPVEDVTVEVEGERALFDFTVEVYRPEKLGGKPRSTYEPHLTVRAEGWFLPYQGFLVRAREKVHE